jgi:hypothetical protein
MGTKAEDADLWLLSRRAERVSAGQALQFPLVEGGSLLMFEYPTARHGWIRIFRHQREQASS